MVVNDRFSRSKRAYINVCVFCGAEEEVDDQGGEDSKEAKRRLRTEPEMLKQ